MKNLLKLVVLILPALIILDLVWIAGVAQGIYQSQIGFLLATEVVWWAAIVFYILYAIALAYFVVLPAIKQGNLKSALYNGLFFGLVCFATYDLTNLSTVRDWPVAITVIDMVYGTIVAGVVSALAYLLGKKLVK
jgi:uncharacterized membrane protein